MHQEIKYPTQYTDTSAKLIDIIATTSLDLVEDTEVHAPTLTNHCDVSILLNLRKPKHEQFKRKIYLYEEANWEQMLKDIAEYDWGRSTK